jgi:DNA primase
MSRSTRRLDQIKKHVPIQQVLADYGYKIHMGGTYQEQQFPCDLHGDGHDSKPSARMYPETNQWYCFACSKSRDVVETVRAKEGLEFMDAIAFIERKYDLPQVPWEDDDSVQSEQGPTSRSVASILDQKATFADDRKKLVAALEAVTEDRLLPMDTVAAHWEALDKTTYLVKEGQLGEVPARMILVRLYDRLIAALNPGVA